MTTEEIIKLLPTSQSVLVRRHANASQLGGEYIIYRRESVEVGPEELCFESPEYTAERMKKTKRHWGGYCTCTSCGEDFITGWRDGHPVMIVGDDGMAYDGWTNGEDESCVVLCSGDTLDCPYCGIPCVMIRASDIRHGRKYQMLYTVLDNLCGNIAIITYLASRWLTDTGFSPLDIAPRDAAVLLPGGRLKCFSRSKKGMFGSYEKFEDWRYISHPSDPMQRLYYNCDAWGGRQFGSVLIADSPFIPEGFEGTTAEKTGLCEYLASGGDWPYVYLDFWRRHKTVENLLKSGFHRFVVDEIDEHVNTEARYGRVPANARDELSCVDFAKAKPHEMLGMTKAEFQAAQNYEWNSRRLYEWGIYNTGVERISPEDFALDLEIFGESNVYRITEDFLCWESDLTLGKLHRYIKKQNKYEPEYAARLFIDYRTMFSAIYGDRMMTPEEEYPRDIEEAHDRLSDIINARENTKNIENFRRVKREYGALEWTDGELCIIIPESNDDLVNEGKTLRHCVGSYGKDHLSGKMIFFVRHYRRPERSYYTLNENLTGDTPFRVQLHGYGNEHHGEHKQYSHSIPKKVTDFVDRWEEEILEPWYAKHQAEKKKSKKKEKAA